MKKTTRLEQGDAPAAKNEPKKSRVKEGISPVLARLIEEVRQEEPKGPHAYDRVHNRHNR